MWLLPVVIQERRGSTNIGANSVGLMKSCIEIQLNWAIKRTRLATLPEDDI